MDRIREAVPQNPQHGVNDRPRMSFTVFLGNLPVWVTKDDIKSWLNAENLVYDDVKVIRNPETQESKGFAFIDTPNSEEMNLIIRRFDRAPLEDRLLRANQAQPPRSKGPGPGPAGQVSRTAAAVRHAASGAEKNTSVRSRVVRKGSPALSPKNSPKLSKLLRTALARGHSLLCIHPSCNTACLLQHRPYYQCYTQWHLCNTGAPLRSAIRMRRGWLREQSANRFASSSCCLLSAAAWFLAPIRSARALRRRSRTCCSACSSCCLRSRFGKQR